MLPRGDVVHGAGTNHRTRTGTACRSATARRGSARSRTGRRTCCLNIAVGLPEILQRLYRHGTHDATNRGGGSSGPYRGGDSALYLARSPLRANRERIDDEDPARWL
jgi:hypothetical protein